MQSLSRRSFLHKGSLAVGAVGAAAAVPTLGRRLALRGRAVPAGAVPSFAAAHEDVHADVRTEGPIVAHVRDVRRGEIDVFVGTRKVTLRDRATAALLYRATR